MTISAAHGCDQQRADEDGGDEQADGDGGGHVARRRWCRRPARRAGARRHRRPRRRLPRDGVDRRTRPRPVRHRADPMRSSVGSVPIVIRPGSRRGTGADGSSTVSSYRPRRARRRRRGRPADRARRCGAGSSLHTGASFGERRPHVEVVGGVGRRAWLQHPRHLARGRLGPVRQRTRCRRCRTTGSPDDRHLAGRVVAEQRWAEVLVVSSSAGRVARHRRSCGSPRSSVVHGSLRPRAVPAPCGRGPCRSARRGRG